MAPEGESDPGKMLAGGMSEEKLVHQLSLPEDLPMKLAKDLPIVLSQ